MAGLFMCHFCIYKNDKKEYYEQEMKTTIRKALIDTIPVMTGYIVLGIGFGIIMSTNGYSVWWSLAMSLFIYAGSMQYAAIGLLTGGASLITCALTTLMVNARHLFYGISMVDRYKNTGKAKPYLIFALTDETYALVCDGKEDMEPKERKKYFLYTSIFDQFYWVSGSFLGALIGVYITFDTAGIDFALTALFITIFTDQWMKASNKAPAVIGLVATISFESYFWKLFLLNPVHGTYSICTYSYEAFSKEGGAG